MDPMWFTRDTVTGRSFRQSSSNSTTDTIPLATSTVTAPPEPRSLKSLRSRTWAVVPARAGSKGVPDKNLQTLGGLTLLEHAVACAERVADMVLVSTDYPWSRLPEAARKHYTPRPAHLATDNAGMLSVLAHLADHCAWDELDTIILLQPSSFHPHRAFFVREELDRKSVVSAWRVPDKWHPFYAQDPANPHANPKCRQSLPPRYRPNGLFYMMDGFTAKTERLWHGPVRFVECDCINIDTLDDLLEAQRVYGR